MSDERVTRLVEDVAVVIDVMAPPDDGSNVWTKVAARRVLRAIVETLGITAEGVDDLARTDGFEVEARALRTLLAAAHGGTDGE